MFVAIVGSLIPVKVTTSSVFYDVPFLRSRVGAHFTVKPYVVITASACWFVRGVIRRRVVPKTPVIPRRILVVFLGIWWVSMALSNIMIAGLYILGGLQ